MAELRRDPHESEAISVRTETNARFWPNGGRWLTVNMQAGASVGDKN